MVHPTRYSGNPSSKLRAVIGLMVVKYKVLAQNPVVIYVDKSILFEKQL